MFQKPNKKSEKWEEDWLSHSSDQIHIFPFIPKRHQLTHTEFWTLQFTIRFDDPSETRTTIKNPLLGSRNDLLKTIAKKILKLVEVNFCQLYIVHSSKILMDWIELLISVVKQYSVETPLKNQKIKLHKA
jgi:hypothetical protein